MLFSIEPMDGVAKNREYLPVVDGKNTNCFCQSIERDDLIVMGV